VCSIPMRRRQCRPDRMHASFNPGSRADFEQSSGEDWSLAII
jgi:hypothetical protein